MEATLAVGMLVVGRRYSLDWACRDIGYGVEEGSGEYVYLGLRSDKFAFAPVASDVWHVQVRDEDDGLRADFAIHASTPAQALHETARNLAYDKVARRISIRSTTGPTVYLLDDEFSAAAL